MIVYSGNTPGLRQVMEALSRENNVCLCLFNVFVLLFFLLCSQGSVLCAAEQIFPFRRGPSIKDGRRPNSKQGALAVSR